LSFPSKVQSILCLPSTWTNYYCWTRSCLLLAAMLTVYLLDGELELEAALWYNIKVLSRVHTHTHTHTHTHIYIYIERERERQNYILGILHNSISIVSQDTNFRHNYWWRLGSFRRILIFRGRGLEHSGPLQYWKSFPTSLFFFFFQSLYIQWLSQVVWVLLLAFYSTVPWSLLINAFELLGWMSVKVFVRAMEFLTCWNHWLSRMIFIPKDALFSNV